MADIPAKNPSWMESILKDIDCLIYNRKVEKKLGAGRSTFKYYATVTNNKLGGGEGAHDIDLKTNPKATKELIEKILTSPMGFKIE